MAMSRLTLRKNEVCKEQNKRGPLDLTFPFLASLSPWVLSDQLRWFLKDGYVREHGWV